MDTLHIALFVVALGFGIAQHLLDDDNAPITAGVPRWWANGLLFAAETASVTLFAAAIVWLTSANATPAISPFAIGGWPVLTQIGLFLFVHSFMQYWIHRAGHRVPLLWSWHRIHHSDPALDATTGFRHHPFESMMDYGAFLLPTLLLAPSAAAVLSYFLLHIFFAMFTHLPPKWVPQRIDRALSVAVNTPSLHQLHHSSLQIETDTNYGNVLMIWDRLFGTYLAAPSTPRPGFTLGLDEFPQQKAQDPFLLLASPFLSPDHRDQTASRGITQEHS
jgi:sterol desaturase/sphingolipid hydroxylase (fatty acid hydroxylase superfamily)